MHSPSVGWDLLSRNIWKYHFCFATLQKSVLSGWTFALVKSHISANTLYSSRVKVLFYVTLLVLWLQRNWAG